VRKAVGEAVYARGARYHADGRVEIVSIDADRAIARVAGTETYTAVLYASPKDAVGECTCRAFEGYGFCKHLVATALAVAALDGSAIEPAASRRDSIRDHLHSKGIDELIDMIMRLAEHDPTLRDNLEFAAATADHGNDEDLFRQVKARITEVTRTRGLVAYREVGGSVAAIDPVLAHIEELVEARRPRIALRLLEYFFERMESALGKIDDSNGDGGALYARACGIHLAACRKASPDAIELARDFFVRETESDWDFFSGAAIAYAEILGEHGLAEYRRLAEEAWRAVKPRRPGQLTADDPDFSLRYRLTAILDWFAEREGDLDARIALRNKDLSSAHAYLQLAQLCLNNGREAQALQWAEEGLWQFESAPDERLTLFVAKLYRAAGRQADADALLWRAFEREPSLRLYDDLRAGSGSEAGATLAIRDKAIAVLRAQIESSDRTPHYVWDDPADLLVRIAMSEGLLALAWEVASAHRCSDGLLEALAEASEETHPEESLSTYRARVESLVRLTNRAGYENACQLIRRMAGVSERSGKGEEHRLWLDGLKRRHKPKRIFMALLKAQEEGTSTSA
jgi:uncharacterized Zn finger protein